VTHATFVLTIFLTSYLIPVLSRHATTVYKEQCQTHIAVREARSIKHKLCLKGELPTTVLGFMISETIFGLSPLDTKQYIYSYFTAE